MRKQAAPLPDEALEPGPDTPWVRVRQREVGEWSQHYTVPLKDGQELVADYPPHDRPRPDVPWTPPSAE